MESKTYKELQALAKLHGIKANGTRKALIGKLRSKLGESVCDNEDHQSQGTSHDSTLDDGDELRDPEMPAIDSDPSEPAVTTERRKSERLSATKQTMERDASTVDAPALAGSSEPVVTTERRKSERLSATKQTMERDAPTVDAPALAGSSEPVVATERRKSERLSATKQTMDRDAPTVDAPALAGSSEPVVATERRKSERLSATKMTTDHVAPTVHAPEGTMKSKGEHLSAGKQVTLKKSDLNSRTNRPT